MSAERRNARRSARAVLPLAACTTIAMGCASVSAETVAEFYAGKTLTIHVGFSSGGGYDLYARVLAPHLAKHIPGKPQVIVKNLPGAGSLKLVSYMQSVAPRNGTEMATVTRGAPVEELLTNSKTGMDPTGSQWIGSMNNEASLCVVNASTGVQDLAGMRAKELSFGTQGKGSDSELFAVFIKNLLGVKLKVVTGYPGTNESILALERKEVDGNCGWSWSSAKQLRPAWFKDGTVNIIMQMSLTKHPDLTHVPLIGEFAKTPEEKQQVELVMSRQVMGRPFYFPPGVPSDRVAAVRKAFMDALADPEFKAAADKAQLEVNPVSGDELQALVGKLVKTSPAIVAATRRSIESN